MSFEYILLYSTIVFVATIIPGPSMILALQHGIVHGYNKTLATALGNTVANTIMASLSLAGLGVVILASGTAFIIIKWIGAGYLIYLGIKTIISKSLVLDNSHKLPDDTGQKNKKPLKLFTDGFIVAAGNPKGIVFFTALFPQVIDYESATVLQFGILLSILAGIAIGCFMLYAFFGERMRSLFAHTFVGKIFNKITGSIFITFGLILAFRKSH